ncbi:hypothetical protein H8959_017927, partial [Pygathrix nigripes]
TQHLSYLFHKTSSNQTSPESCASKSRDSWDELLIGDVELKRLMACSRCILTTVDPDTGVMSRKEPLETLKSVRLPSPWLPRPPRGPSVPHSPPAREDCGRRAAFKARPRSEAVTGRDPALASSLGGARAPGLCSSVRAEKRKRIVLGCGRPLRDSRAAPRAPTHPVRLDCGSRGAHPAGCSQPGWLPSTPPTSASGRPLTAPRPALAAAPSPWTPPPSRSPPSASQTFCMPAWGTWGRHRRAWQGPRPPPSPRTWARFTRTPLSKRRPDPRFDPPQWWRPPKSRLASHSGCLLSQPPTTTITRSNNNSNSNSRSSNSRRSNSLRLRLGLAPCSPQPLGREWSQTPTTVARPRPPPAKTSNLELTAFYLQNLTQKSKKATR